jgi:hypothetical protein
MSTREQVIKAVMDCEGVAWDGCHKVFVLMDKEQVERLRHYGYGDKTDVENGDSRLETADTMKRSEMYALVKEWYDQSCMLKFVQSIATGDAGEEYGNLVPQSGYWR